MSGNPRRSRSPRSAPGSSWDHVAGWYDGWVGQQGSIYHRALAVPAVLELLDARRGESVVDVGCGQGVLAPHVARLGARYTGIDASPRLIDVARRRHGRDGRFAVADARRLPSAGVPRASFDAAVFLLSIQDIDPLEDAIAAVSRVLRATSRIVVLMTHPAFRQPRHSGWGYDDGRKLTYRRIDAYLTPMAVPMKSVNGGTPTRAYHRPISAYVSALAAEGFAVDGMTELPDLPAADRPRSRRPETRADAEIPLFLAIRARRP
ncbi:MAG: class I SAM-dependent methyltransferase [Chloroflexota bacterium]